MLKTTVNGNSIAYERGGKGKAIVLVHGYPLDHTIWEPLVATLENRADVVMPDLRGFGKSAVPKADYRLSDLAADLLALLDFNKDRSGCHRRPFHGRVRGPGFCACLS